MTSQELCADVINDLSILSRFFSISEFRNLRFQRRKPRALLTSQQQRAQQSGTGHFDAHLTTNQTTPLLTATIRRHLSLLTAVINLLCCLTSRELHLTLAAMMTSSFSRNYLTVIEQFRLLSKTAPLADA